jgi:hypothetical protein
VKVRVGTSGWNYPSGKGTWNGLFLSEDAIQTQGTDRFDELAFYAEHFNTVEVNSTFYGQPPCRRDPRVGCSHAVRIRLLAQALSEVHASEDVQGGGPEERAGLGR